MSSICHDVWMSGELPAFRHAPLVQVFGLFDTLNSPCGLSALIDRDFALLLRFSVLLSENAFLLPGQPRRIPVEPTFSLIYLRWSGFERLNRPAGHLIKCINLLFTNESFNKLCSDCSVALFYFKVVQFISVFNFLSDYLVTRNSSQ